MAATDTPGTFETAAYGTVFFNGKNKKTTARRMKTTVFPKQWAQQNLIESYTADEDLT
jgi:hypothetical protein